MSGPIPFAPPRTPHAGAGGFGLIEVLVAMTLGLVLLGGVGYLFIGSKQMSVAQSDGVRMNESARNATDVMGRALRQAGYKLNVDVPLQPGPLGGLDGGGAAATAGSDILIVRHDPAWTATSATGLRTGSEANCEGATVASNNPNDPGTGAPGLNTAQVVYQFRVVETQLKCFATDNQAVDTKTGVVVAENVENMQVSYGIGSGGEVVNAYVDSPTAAEYRQVSAVRISLLVRGPSTKGVVGGTQSINFNGGAVAIADGRLRSVVTTTFMVRNQTRWN
ncbi:PilW family protein [Massilia genomosp. 1]|nr:PilW family protein [Massilia genomosp. 1]